MITLSNGETLQGEGDNYEHLRDELLARVPEGEQAWSIRVDRNT